MPTPRVRRLVFAALLAAAAHPACGAEPAADQPLPTVARGVVYHDADGDGVRSAGERGIANVRVSNGREVVLTDEQGRYTLPISDDAIVFVSKPRDWAYPLDEHNLPIFYYVHKPAGSPEGLDYPGVLATGPLPESIDFALRPSPEPETLEILLLGDPQPRDLAEVDFFAHDVITELVGRRPDLTIALGDIAFDDLRIYTPYNQAMSTIGSMVVNVHGNHDINFDVTSDHLADETWERVYGPANWSFDLGPAHIIILDNVMYDGHIEEGKYHAEFGERTLAFLENTLRLVPRDRFILLCMHIPLVEATDRARVLELLSAYPRTFSLSAHWHAQRHYYLGSDDGWTGPGRHHHLVHATASGSWWQGAPDEFGIPHTLMRDGTPNGHSTLTVSAAGYSVRFKPARRPADDQISIFLPSALTRAATGGHELIANFYAGGERCTLEFRVGDGAFAPMTRTVRPDPYFLALKAAEESETPPNGRKLPKPIDSHHVWTASLPALEPGVHVVEIRATDQFGQVHSARRILRVNN